MTATEIRPAQEAGGGASDAARPVRWCSGRVSFRMHRRTALVSGGALLLAALLLLVSLGVGSYPVPVPDVARALFHGTGDRLAVHFVNQERLPQALLAILVGGALGMSGAIFQSVSRNALASPDVIGFNSGAATGAILVIVTFGGGAAPVAAGAIVGGLVTALLVSVLASRGGLHGIRLVLIGLGVTAMLGSVLLDPAVLVLDEATADIDPETARTLETAIDTLRADRTLIVIAHREATIRRLPRIFRLDENAVLAHD